LRGRLTKSAASIVHFFAFVKSTPIIFTFNPPFPPRLGRQIGSGRGLQQPAKFPIILRHHPEKGKRPYPCYPWPVPGRLPKPATDLPPYQHLQMWIFPANSSARGRISTPLSTATIFEETTDDKTHGIPACTNAPKNTSHHHIFNSKIASPFDTIPELITQTINTRTIGHQQEPNR